MHQSHIFMHLMLHLVDLTVVLAFYSVLLAIKLTSRYYYNTWERKNIFMDQLKQDQEALRLEVIQLKDQFIQILYILSVIMSNLMLVAEPEVVTPVNVPGSTPHQDLPRGYYPQSGSPRAPYPQPFPVPRPRKRDLVWNQYSNQQQNYHQ